MPHIDKWLSGHFQNPMNETQKKTTLESGKDLKQSPTGACGFKLAISMIPTSRLLRFWFRHFNFISSHFRLFSHRTRSLMLYHKSSSRRAREIVLRIAFISLKWNSLFPIFFLNIFAYVQTRKRANEIKFAKWLFMFGYALKIFLIFFFRRWNVASKKKNRELKLKELEEVSLFGFSPNCQKTKNKETCIIP